MYVPGQSFGLRILGDQLRTLREAAGISRADAAREVEKNTPVSVGHYETGKRLIPPLDLKVLAKLYGCSDEQLAELRELRERATQPSEYASFGLPEDAVVYLDMEGEAHTICTWQNLLIPGLLQAEPYMRKVFELAKVPASEIDQRIRARHKRQEHLSKVELNAVIAEEALIRCAKVPAQVARLAQLAELDNIDIRIMPLWAGLHRGMDGSFTHLALDLGYKFAYQETASGSHLAETPSTVRFLVTLFEELRDQALDRNESLVLISRLAHQGRKETPE